MDEYLKNTVNKLNSSDYAELNLVLGNESCDLDSAVCAVVYATFLNWQYNQIKCKVCTKAKRDDDVFKDDIFVPMLNVDRQDYELKTEVAFCLRDHGINETNLVFRDDHNLQQLINGTKTNVILVDHHVLSKNDQFLTPHVTEIIDHRPLDKSQWGYREDTRCTLETVGSCSTLVTQRIKDLSALMKKDGDFFEAYRVCTDLLHCTIVLDTVNFSKEVNKATPHDKEIVVFLESVLKPADCEAERKMKLSRLVCARGDVSPLSAAQLLRKDVKVVGDVLVPSFPILVKDFLSRTKALQAVSEALTSRGCSIALLLGMDLTGGLARDAAVYSVDRNRASELGKFLENWTSPQLELVGEHLADCLYYQQLNLSASRKQYMPAVAQFLNVP